MAASSSAASSSTSFARLLRNSKVISQYDPTIQSLVYTSHGGSAKRSDFGLKRSLPRLRSPAIRISHLDSPTTKLTDFEYASRELQFVKRWREAGVGLSDGDPTYSDTTHEERLKNVSEKPGACTWDRESFEDVEELKQVAKTGKRRAERMLEEQRRADVQLALEQEQPEQGQQQADPQSSPAIAFPPDYLNMSERTFEDFLSKLRTLQPKYKAFLQEHQQHRRPSSDDSEASTIYDIYTSSTTPTTIMNSTGFLIDKFLSQELGVSSHDPKFDTLKSQPHRSMGLSYAPPNLYHTDVSTRTIPARRLGAVRAARGAGRGIDTSAMGLIDVLPTQEMGNTTSAVYMPDREGYLNPDFGKMNVRIEAAAINPNYIGRQRNGGDEMNYFATQSSGPGSSSSSATTSKSLLDQDPISVRFYQAESTGQAPTFRSSCSAGGKTPTTPEYRVGGQAWVAFDPKSQSEKSMSETPTRELFYGSLNTDKRGMQKITPPNVDEFAKPDQVPGGRSKDRKAAANKGDDSVASLLARLNSLSAQSTNARTRTNPSQATGQAQKPVKSGRFARFER